MNARVLSLLSLVLALAETPVRAAEPQAQALQKKLAAELLAPEPAPAASVPAPAAAPAAAQAPEDPPPLQLRNPVVGSAAVSIPAWPALLVLAGLGGVLFWTRRRTPRAAAVPLQRLASLPMGARRSLVLVEVMQQRLLVGSSEKGLALIARLDGPLSPEGPAVDDGDPSTDERAFGRLLDAAEAAEQRPEAAAAGRVPGEQRDLARKLRGLGRS